MADSWNALDYDDPCAVLAALRPAYHRLIAGEREVEIRFDGQSVRFTESGMSRLESRIKTLEAECAAKNGKRKRFAIRAGSRRRVFRPF